MPPLAILLPLLLTLLVGCSSVQLRLETTVAPTNALPTLHKVVVLPFVNRTDNSRACVAMNAALESNLAARGHLDIIDVPPRFNVDAEHLDREQAHDLAVAVGADAVITGIVFAYGYVPEPGNPPRPTILADVRVFGAQSASLLWAGRARATDASGMATGGASLTALADALAGQIANELIVRR